MAICGCFLVGRPWAMGRVHRRTRPASCCTLCHAGPPALTTHTHARTRAHTPCPLVLAPAASTGPSLPASFAGSRHLSACPGVQTVRACSCSNVRICPPPWRLLPSYPCAPQMDVTGNHDNSCFAYSVASGALLNISFNGTMVLFAPLPPPRASRPLPRVLRPLSAVPLLQEPPAPRLPRAPPTPPHLPPPRLWNTRKQAHTCGGHCCLTPAPEHNPCASRLAARLAYRHTRKAVRGGRSAGGAQHPYRCTGQVHGTGTPWGVTRAMARPADSYRPYCTILYRAALQAPRCTQTRSSTRKSTGRRTTVTWFWRARRPRSWNSCRCTAGLECTRRRASRETG